MLASRSVKKELLAGGIIFLLTVFLCMAVGRIMYFAGDFMIGCHPLILFLFVYGGLLMLACMAGCIMKKWPFSVMALASTAVVAVVFTQGYRIETYAWARSLEQYDENNQKAILEAANLPELAENSLEQVFSDDAIPILKGFKWYCEHHLASPGGAFRAFIYKGVVHVRIQKIRHGYKGVAFIPFTGDIRRIQDSELIYEDMAPVAEHWLVWRSH